MRYSTDDHGQVSFNDEWTLPTPCRVIIFAETSNVVYWAKCTRRATNLKISIGFHHLPGAPQRQFLIIASGEDRYCHGVIDKCLGEPEAEALNTIKCLTPKVNLINVYYKSSTFRAGFIPFSQGVVQGMRVGLFSIKPEFRAMYGEFGVHTRTGRHGSFVNVAGQVDALKIKT